MSHKNFGLEIEVLKGRGKPEKFPDDADVIIYQEEEEGRVVVRISDSMSFNEFEVLFNRMKQFLVEYRHKYTVNEAERTIEVWFMGIENVEPYFFG